MFKRLLIVSGILSVLATGIFYDAFILPDVDVTSIEPVGALSLDNVSNQPETGAIIAVNGRVQRTGRSLVGKTELFLIDSTGKRTIFCSFAIGHPKQPLHEGDLLTVKGVWNPIPKTDFEPVCVGKLTDCVLIE